MHYILIFAFICLELSGQNCNNPELYHTGTINGQPYAFIDANGNPYYMNGLNVRTAVQNGAPRYSQSQFNEISAKGFNSIRLALDWKYFETAQGVFNTSEFDALDEVILRAKNAGLTVILDPIHLKGDTSSDFWNIPAWAWGNVTPATTKVWDEINAHALPYLEEFASRYCGNETVIAIDLVNEPREPNDANNLYGRNNLLVNMYVNWINALRQIDADKIFLVEPFYGSTYITSTNLVPLGNLDNVVWSFHDYYAGEGNSSSGFKSGGYPEQNGEGGNRTETWDTSFPYPKNNRTDAMTDMLEHINVNHAAANGAGLPTHVGEFGIPYGWTGEWNFMCDKKTLYTDLNIPISAWVWNKDIDGGFGLFQPNNNGAGTWMTWADPLVNSNCGEYTLSPDQQCNLIKNTDFDNGQSDWYIYESGTTSSTWNANNGTANFTITNGSTGKWRIQLIQAGLNLKQGKDYVVYFKAKASAAKPIYCSLTDINDNTYLYEYQDVTIGTTWQNYSFSFSMTDPDDTNARINFGIGGNNTDIEFDEIIVQELDCVCPNYISNSSFDFNLNNYDTYISGDGVANASLNYNSTGNYANFVINNGSSLQWKVQLKQGGISLVQGETYTLTFRAKAASTKNIYFKITNANDTGSPYHTLQYRNISNNWEQYNYTFTMNSPSDANATINFGIGANNINIDFDDINLYNDDCALTACEGNLIHFGEVAAGTYHVSDYIISSGNISSPKRVDYKSGNVICLDKNFTVKSGAELNVINEDCSPQN